MITYFTLLDKLGVNPVVEASKAQNLMVYTSDLAVTIKVGEENATKAITVKNQVTP